MAHSCKYLVIHCIDFRVQNSLNSFLTDKGMLGSCDIVSVAGATHGFDGHLLRQIQTSVELHNTGEIVIIHHTDCGATGGRNAFPSDEAERLAHEEEMDNAKKTILEKFPKLNVQTYLMNTSTGMVFDKLT